VQQLEIVDIEHRARAARPQHITDTTMLAR
jgi:hypothetical protein